MGELSGDDKESLRLMEIVNDYMSLVPEIRDHCERCLKTERYGGNVVLMLVDASFTSIGLNYFKSVVPKVLEFKKEFGKIKTLSDLSKANVEELRRVWKNLRSWNVAIEVAKYLSKLSKDDRIALRTWAKNSSLENWKGDLIGRIKGVGLITYQYLRMMGGIDTVMPDKIVKRVINEILSSAGMERVEGDLEFIKVVERIAKICNYRPIELCWMTWLVQYSDEERKRYLELLYEL
ncbi:MAG: hypothetical protein NZ872_05005 [Archaeoglobaceae archaeon]|nr:hypothetical protein [Archaeoglobaceae archaeon]MDW8128558.1 hypothetical protein [Archaeoglobaceae archaeon]